ncbi:hypothetical protein LEP1GSC168_0141 [Leptospira santarosai str. HAI134]|uniref:STAS domain-containing protein n=2 Tax=Leptospira santarosai TaxID=28183 RepID=A0A0E2BP95_9LEPT|nr:hypothetical protein LEP1GSC179_0002 [Leptospira santarosai str. MOR084]EMO21157.1 hypothetical protein LEP1GSC168_0141 [Leptospira santarosai str. HAI134]
MGGQWKRFLKKRSKRSAKRKQKRKSKIKLRKQNHTRLIIDSPLSLSFIHNKQETAEFFHKIIKGAKSNKKIFLNLQKVTKITGDAILYLLSIAEKYAKKSILIEGSSPLNVEAAKYLEASGFYNFANTGKKFHSINHNFFKIRRGTEVEPKILQEAIQFSMSKCQNKDILNFLKKEIYRSLNEATGNVKQHAYLHQSEERLWWLLVEFIEFENRLRFYVLDSGLGIPQTIEKKILEKLFDFLPLPGLLRHYTDADYILSAMKGQFRTRTKKPFRGLGLPEICDIANNNNVSEFTIVSNYGFLDVKKEVKETLHKKIFGTILTWEIQLS